jgi:hypothetical protein
MNIAKRGVSELDRLEPMMVKGLQVTVVRKLAKEAAYASKTLEALITLVSSEKPTPAMKASWILAKALEENPNQTEEVLMAVFDTIRPSQQGGVLRELFKGLMLSNVPESLHGRHIALCFEYLNLPTVDVAVRSNCMKTLHNYVKRYPELIPEFFDSLEYQIGKHTSTFDAMAMRILKSKGKC